MFRLVMILLLALLLAALLVLVDGSKTPGPPKPGQTTAAPSNDDAFNKLKIP